MELVLRPTRPDDREFFFATRRDAFRTYSEPAFGPWDDVKQRDFADRDFAELAIDIVEHGGARVGYQVVLRHADHWFLDEIAVVAAERRRGIGTRLVEAIAAGAHAAGLPLRLSVLEVNPAQRLYARLGFCVTRIEPPRVKMEYCPRT